MNIEFTPKQFRRLLDLVYIGNWIINSIRPSNDRIVEFDRVESYMFSLCAKYDMKDLCEVFRGESFPSRAFVEGGIHEAIMDYEDTVFFEILAEELAHRDMYANSGVEDAQDLKARIDAYIDEFEKNGVENVSVDVE